MPRFIAFHEFSGTDAIIDDTGLISITDGSPKISIAPSDGSKAFKIQGIAFTSSAPTIAVPADRSLLVVARAHQGVVFKILGIVSVNSDPADYSTFNYHDPTSSNNRVFHRPGVSTSREITVDFTDDDDLVTRECTIEIFSMNPGVGNPSGVLIRTVARDVSRLGY